jgi:hypothetical protein
MFDIILRIIHLVGKKQFTLTADTMELYGQSGDTEEN